MEVTFGAPRSKTEVNNLPLPAPQREAQAPAGKQFGVLWLDWTSKTSLPWFCPRSTWDLLGQLHQPLLSTPLLGPAQVTGWPVCSCLSQRHLIPAPPKLQALHAPQASVPALFPLQHPAFELQFPTCSLGFFLHLLIFSSRPGSCVRHPGASLGTFISTVIRLLI